MGVSGSSAQAGSALPPLETERSCRPTGVKRLLDSFIHALFQDPEVSRKLTHKGINTTTSSQTFFHPTAALEQNISFELLNCPLCSQKDQWQIFCNYFWNLILAVLAHPPSLLCVLGPVGIVASRVKAAALPRPLSTLAPCNLGISWPACSPRAAD